MRTLISNHLRPPVMVGLTLLILLLMSACIFVQQVPAGEGEVGEKILVGKITQEELFKQCPIFQANTAPYVPDQAAVAKLRKIDKKTEILMFLGTWCPDSMNESPKFLKVYDTVNNPNFTLQLYGVDRAKQDGLGLTKKFEVQRVPTIIFLRDGKELGRIIEFPKKSMEEDALEILSRSQ